MGTAAEQGMAGSTGTLQIHDWLERDVRIRGSLTGEPPWTVAIDRLVIRWGRVEGTLVSRYFCTAFAGGKIVTGLRAIRVDLYRGREDRRHLQVRLLADDGRVTRAARFTDRAKEQGKEPRYFREDQCMGIRASIVAWLESCGCSPMVV